MNQWFSWAWVVRTNQPTTHRAAPSASPTRRLASSQVVRARKATSSAAATTR